MNKIGKRTYEQMAHPEEEPKPKLLQPANKQATLWGYCVDKEGNPAKQKDKLKKHPLSLWRDETLLPRELDVEKEGTIFDIIMPWVSELAREQQA
jgi:hypothetical protein